MGKERSDLYRKLGQALFELDIRPPVLDEWVRRVAAIDTSRMELEERPARIDGRDAGAAPGNDAPFFRTALVGGPLLVIALVWGASSLLLRSQAPNATIAAPVGLDPQSERIAPC